MIRHIGDDSIVKSHHDNWIPRRGSLKPLREDYVHGVSRVSDLIRANGTTWDVAKAESMFPHDDAHDIKHIAIGGLG